MKATMTVYKGSSMETGEIVEENIILSDYQTSDELHGLFESLGFEKEEMTEEMKELTRKERKRKELKNRDEEEIRRRKMELRHQMEHKGRTEEAYEKYHGTNEEAQMETQLADMLLDGQIELDALNVMIEESKADEERFHELIKEAEEGLIDEHNEEFAILSRKVENIRIMVAQRKMLEAKIEQLRGEHIRQSKEQRDEARTEF